MVLAKRERDVRSVTRTWHLLPHQGPAIELLARQADIPPVVAQLLLNRNITTPEQARRFLEAPLNGLYEPERLPGIVAAAERLHAAAREQRPICVYGDYDVDGISGTAILVTTLRALGAKVEWHVPHRIDDGYGLNAKALQQIAQNGASLVVTVDCGIASVAEAEEARRLGLEIIVTDHHEFKQQLPNAHVLVHPRLKDGGYPFGGLSGAGVALKLAWAVGKLASGGDKVTARLREVLLDAVGLAALGTVADVMPLVDENRILVRHGLARLKRQPSEGVRALLHSSKLDERPQLTASDIGYTLAPRLNAAGRLGSARVAVELLITTSPQLADDAARNLEEHNYQRQQIERRILAEARQIVDRNSLLERPALVLASGGWHAGLIGIVAGRLTDLFARPALMISLTSHESLAVGSGRSVPGFALHQALEACSGHLVSHGGHAAAAGFKLRPTAIPLFHERFVAVAGEHFTEGPPRPCLLIDAEVALSTLTLKLVDSLNQLEPYGQGNPQPLFLAGDLEVAGEPRRVGEERHLSFRVRQQGGSIFKAIAFNMGDRINELMSAAGRCCLVFTPRINEWQGYRNVELTVKDFQAGPRARLEG
jgi:single-stranded-DNA-specific exonuclease